MQPLADLVDMVGGALVPGGLQQRLPSPLAMSMVTHST